MQGNPPTASASPEPFLSFVPFPERTARFPSKVIAVALERLTQSHPDLRNHLFTGESKLRAFVNLYLNDEDVRYVHAKEATAVTPVDTLSIAPAIAGASPFDSLRAGYPDKGAFGAGPVQAN